MCGIVAVLGVRSDGSIADAARVPDAIDQALTLLGGEASADTGGLLRAAALLEGADAALRGLPGVLALVRDPALRSRIERSAAAVDGRLGAIEARLETSSGAGEEMNRAIVRLKDAVWSVRRDRIRAAEATASLAGARNSDAALAGYSAVQVALSAIDRLEVRGRDSAGLHVLVADHGVDLNDHDIARAIRGRSDALFTSRAVRVPNGHLAFVYKVAAEIGELGDNTAALRESIRTDELLGLALSGESSRVTVLGHTRWASVGLISEPNAHPLNNEEDGLADGPYVIAALNGDIDNHLDLRQSAGVRLPPEITTDAKLIPVLVSRALRTGADPVDAFRETVASFYGSVAIAAGSADDPDRLLLALRGSGQALYVGLAPGAFVVASEPYGLVEETSRYIRLDGEAPSAGGAQGQVLVLDRSARGTLDGVRRYSYDGTELPLTPSDVRQAEITTRDIDRGGEPHFLIKEIAQSPDSVRKTLRGKVLERDGRWAVALPREALPDDVVARVRSGSIRRVVAIGQGTAAIASRAVAAAVAEALGPAGIRADALASAELSGFGLADDMSDTLVVAVSQSGTTVDTNRTVDLVRARGAAIVAIVNRRNSDLVEKAHGVLYTSDGRDMEMAVPSTKAFYMQVVAGYLLALGLADLVGCADARRSHELLDGLRALPAAMESVLASREAIAAAARRHAPSRRYWALVGNGPNRIAAEELRIKLSELCYKAIPCDSTEDKKHIDLSSEPLILVCAAGLDGANADDVAKEIAIYRAHKAAPIVIATQGDERFDAALERIAVPSTHPQLAFVVAAMAGHLFGYEAAVAIDAQARALREIRGAIEEHVTARTSDEGLLDRLRPSLEPLATRFFEELRAGAYNGHLEASVAVRLSSLLLYATGALPLEAFAIEHGKRASPAEVVSELVDALTTGIDQLTRTIDAIKHQAKTVTVGITRSEEAYFSSDLVRAVLAAGAPRDRLTYTALRTLAELDRAVETVTGFTRYRIEGDPEAKATIHVVEKGGIAKDIPSRTESSPELRGSKRRAAAEREVTVARGRADGRTVLFVPEIKNNQVTGLTLLHLSIAGYMPAEDARRVLSAYRGRYQAIVDAVTETEPRFSDDVLASVPFVDLLVMPVHVLADNWRRA